MHAVVSMAASSVHSQSKAQEQEQSCVEQQPELTPLPLYTRLRQVIYMHTNVAYELVASPCNGS